MSKEKLLNEGTIRNFMGLAGIGSLVDPFLHKNQLQEEKEESESEVPQIGLGRKEVGKVAPLPPEIAGSGKGQTVGTGSTAKKAKKDRERQEAAQGKGPSRAEKKKAAVKKTIGAKNQAALEKIANQPGIKSAEKKADTKKADTKKADTKKADTKKGPSRTKTADEVRAKMAKAMEDAGPSISDLPPTSQLKGAGKRTTGKDVTAAARDISKGGTEVIATLGKKGPMKRAKHLPPELQSKGQSAGVGDTREEARMDKERQEVRKGRLDQVTPGPDAIKKLRKTSILKKLIDKEGKPTGGMRKTDAKEGKPMPKRVAGMSTTYLKKRGYKWDSEKQAMMKGGKDVRDVAKRWTKRKERKKREAAKRVDENAYRDSIANMVAENVMQNLPNIEFIDDTKEQDILNETLRRVLRNLYKGN